MSSKSTEKKPQIISVSDVEEPLKLKNVIVPFSKFGNSIQYIYCGNEKIPFRERDPLYQAPKISDEALQMLTAYSWPGNVRQLEQAVLAALAMCETDEIQPSDLPVWFQKAIDIQNDEARLQPSVKSTRPGLKTSPLEREKYSDPERLRYLKALDSTKYSGTGRWNLSAAARQLGVPRKTLIYRLKKMQLIT